MGLNKSKKLAKKSVKPEPVVEDEIEELDEIEEVEEVPAKKAKRSAKPKKVAEPVVEEEDEDEAADDGIELDTDSIVSGIMSDKRNLTSAVYQVQLRLPAELEPLYKALSPRLKKALRDAFGELIRKAYDQTH